MADKVSEHAFVVPSAELVTPDNSDDDFVEVLSTPFVHCRLENHSRVPPD